MTRIAEEKALEFLRTSQQSINRLRDEYQRQRVDRLDSDTDISKFVQKVQSGVCTFMSTEAKISPYAKASIALELGDFFGFRHGER